MAPICYGVRISGSSIYLTCGLFLFFLNRSKAWFRFNLNGFSSLHWGGTQGIQAGHCSWHGHGIKGVRVASHQPSRQAIADPWVACGCLENKFLVPRRRSSTWELRLVFFSSDGLCQKPLSYWELQSGNFNSVIPSTFNNWQLSVKISKANMTFIYRCCHQLELFDCSELPSLLFKKGNYVFFPFTGNFIIYF